MPNTLSVTPDRICKQMAVGQHEIHQKVMLTITGGEALVGYHGRVESDNSEEGWISIEPRSFALDPIYLPYAPITLTITVPKEAQSGSHPFKVRFHAEDPDSEETELEIVLDVQHPLKIWLQQYIWYLIAGGVVALIIVALLGLWVW